MENNPEILGVEVLYQRGAFKRVKRWLRGCLPQYGLITNGKTGLETVQEIDTLKPTHLFKVSEIIQ